MKRSFLLIINWLRNAALDVLVYSTLIFFSLSVFAILGFGLWAYFAQFGDIKKDTTALFYAAFATLAVCSNLSFSWYRNLTDATEGEQRRKADVGIAAERFLIGAIFFLVTSLFRFILYTTTLVAIKNPIAGLPTWITIFNFLASLSLVGGVAFGITGFIFLAKALMQQRHNPFFKRKKQG